MTYQKPSQHYDDNADANESSSLFLTVADASPPSSAFGHDGEATTKKNGIPTMRAMIAAGVLLGTLAMIYSGSRGSSSNISSTANLGTVAVVTSDDSCATEVPGEGPCCDGGTITSCFQVCDYLLRCDNGYVPELITDDAATQFPETSDYQPDNCHCRGYEDHNGCFCRQARDMIVHSVKGAFVGLCDPCPPPPTPSPTTLLSKLKEEQTCKVAGGGYLDDGRRNADTSKPFYLCFVVTEDAIPDQKRLMLIPPTGDSLLDSSLRGGFGAVKIGVHCWTESIQIHGVNVGCYPSGFTRGKNHRITWSGTSGRGNDNCGDPCTEFDVHYPFDRYCTISKGVYQHNTKGYRCYQYKDTAKYCWVFACPKCLPCDPYPFLEYNRGEWHYDGEGEVTMRSDLNSCGPPCTEFDSKHSNLDDDV